MRCLVLVVVSYIIVFLAQEGSACYGEEGYSHTIYRYGSPNTAKGLIWTVVTGATSIEVASCSDPNSCSTIMYPDYFSVSSDDLRSTLTIKNVSRTVPFNMEGTKWTCRWLENNYNYTACSRYNVFANPAKPKCEPPVWNSSTYEMQMACTTLKVYPELYRCRLRMSKENNTFTWKDPWTSYDHVKLDGNLTYYRSTCTVFVPFGDILRYGNYLQITMQVLGGRTIYGDVIQVNPAFIEENVETTTHLGVAITTHLGVETNVHEKEIDTNLPVIIALAVLLALTLCVSIVLAAVMCKNRRQASERPTTDELPKIMTESASTRRYDKVDSQQKESEETYYQDVCDDEIPAFPAPGIGSHYENMPVTDNDYETPSYTAPSHIAPSHTAPRKENQSQYVNVKGGTADTEEMTIYEN